MEKSQWGHALTPLVPAIHPAPHFVMDVALQFVVITGAREFLD